MSQTGGINEFIIAAVKKLVTNQTGPGVDFFDDVNGPWRNLELKVEAFTDGQFVGWKFAGKWSGRSQVGNGSSHDESMIVTGVVSKPVIVVKDIFDINNVDVVLFPKAVFRQRSEFPFYDGHIIEGFNKMRSCLECQSTLEPVGDEFYRVKACGDGAAGDDDFGVFQSRLPVKIRGRGILRVS